jgi:3D (Asp-Asp-Asp) domain-containing protein
MKGKLILLILTIFFGLSFDFSSFAKNGNEAKIPWFEPGFFYFLNENTLSALALPFNENSIERIFVLVTGYSSCPTETDDTPFITAAGTLVRDGVVANNFLPFGTKIRIPAIFGDKIFTVEDRLNWSKGNYLVDVWFENKEEALSFGVKKTYIEILR